MGRQARAGERFQHHPLLASKDATELQAVLSRVYGPHRLHLSSRRDGLNARVNALHVGAITIGYVHYGADVSIRMPDGSMGYHVNIPIAGQAITTYACGSVTTSRGLASVHIPGQPAQIDWPHECSQICVRFDRESIERELESLLGHPIAGPISFRSEVDLTDPSCRNWFNALTLLEQQSAQPIGTMRHDVPLRHLEHFLLASFLFSQPHNYSTELDGPGTEHEPKALRKARDFLEASAGNPLTVKDVARAAGVSVRALQDIFRRQLETTPMGYLREVRLKRVHDELRNSRHGPVSVTSVAQKWGFLHAGRFSGDYRRKFGELPSATLHKADALGRMPTARG